MAIKTVKRWVCDACRGVWFNAPQDKCPSCGGTGRERDVKLREDGSIALTD